MKSVNDIDSYSAEIAQPQRIKSLFQDNGFVLIRNAISIQPLDDLVAAIGKLLAARLQQLGIKSCLEDDLDGNLAQLARFGDDKVEMLLRASRETLAFHKLVLFPALQALSGLVTELKMTQIIFENCMLRIDRSTTSSRDFAWHYDAAYTAQPPQAITCWIPLTPIDDRIGPLRVIPVSHKNEHAVRFHSELASVKLAGPKRIELADIDIAELESKAIDIYPMQPSDVILLHGWTLHRSGMNTSQRARWVFNPRYSDLLDERVVANNWRVSRAGEPWVFAEYHPELVKK